MELVGRQLMGVLWKKDTLYTMNNGVSWKAINGCALERV